MNQITLLILASLGGVFLAIQAGFNSQLGVQLENPFFASFIAFLSGISFALVLFLLKLRSIPSIAEIKEVPLYLWFVGGIFSIVGISIYYYTIPKLGVSTMVSLGLCGQLIFTVIAGYYGWFNLPVEPLSLKKIIGILTLLLGIILINIK